MSTTVIEIGALAHPDRALDLGPEHPSRAGLVRLTLNHVDHVVTGVDIDPGWLHRGAEKLFEVRDYRGVLMLADRHDWQAPFSGELVVALACEHLLGLVPPPRATVLRTLLAEIARIHSHLGFSTFVAHHLGDAALASTIRHTRDATRELMLALSGNRLHPMLNRLGGLAVDAPDHWLQMVRSWVDESAHCQSSLVNALFETRFIKSATIGLLTDTQIDQHGVSGPAVRAVGLARDLRRQRPYLAYGELTWPTLEVPEPDASAGGRFAFLAHEMAESLALVRQCCDLADRTDGPVNVPLSRIIKLPEAETWHTIEAPLGVAGVHLVSRGGTTPWRLKLRTPTFANVSALREVLVGCRLDDVAMVVASFGWTIGDLDK